MPGSETTTQYFNGGLEAVYDDMYPEDRETTMARYENLGVTTALTSGTVVYGFFTARRPRTVTGAAFSVSTTAAATVTTIKYGLYEEGSSGALTLRAVTANDAALLAAADTRYFKAFTSSWALKAGRRYAVALLVVATTMPTLVGNPAVGATFDAVTAGIYNQSPRRCALLASQSDLTASATPTAFSALPILPYAEVGTA